MFPIIGKRFTPEEFAEYVAGLSITDWGPSMVVVHNTSSPTLAQRPRGFTPEHMANLQDFYANTRHWSGGPHCFVDQNGIWVFNPLTKPGVHSPSWNGSAFGVEMLGEYDEESFTTGNGAKVRKLAIAAVSVLLNNVDMEPNSRTIRFHKEDSATTHKDCPGKNVIKVDFVAAVKALTPPAAPALPSGWSVVGPDGKILAEGLDTSEKGTKLVRIVWEASGGRVDPDSEKRVVRLVSKA